MKLVEARIDSFLRSEGVHNVMLSDYVRDLGTFIEAQKYHDTGGIQVFLKSTFARTYVPLEDESDSDSGSDVDDNFETPSSKSSQ